MHGQTVYHQAVAAKFLGAAVRCTSQIGEPALIAERLRVPVVSDFRPADLAAGGQGAPLVPMLDFCAVPARDEEPAAAESRRHCECHGAACGVLRLTGVLAFDTGPANMLIDLLMQQLYNRRFDKNGAVAASGRVLTPVIERLLRHAVLLCAGTEVLRARGVWRRVRASASCAVQAGPRRRT